MRGIKHSNNLDDKDCYPDAKIISGGVNEKSATVLITSRRGCAINSLVEFFIQKSS